MCVSKQLLKLWDEFFMALSEEERMTNRAAGLVYTKMHNFLTDGTENFDEDQEFMLVCETMEELDELWEKVSTKEIKGNTKLTTLFNEFEEHLQWLKAEIRGEDGDDESEEQEEVETEWDQYERPWEDEDEDSEYEDIDWEEDEREQDNEEDDE